MQLDFQESQTQLYLKGREGCREGERETGGKKGNGDEDKNEIVIHSWLFDHLEYPGKDYQQK